MDLIDTHAHLDLIEKMSGENPAAVLDRAAAAGIRRILQIGVDLPSSRAGLALAKKFPGKVFPTAGLHPEPAPREDGAPAPDPRADLADFEKFVRENRAKIFAIGECGLDPTYETPLPAQREVFLTQAKLARELDLPVVVHVRELFDEALAVLGEAGFPRFVIHCFTGDPATAAKILSAGGFVAVGGILTFRRAEELRAAARTVPLDRIFLETDAPFLAPEPHRGEKNEPKFLGKIAEKLAEIYDRPVAEIAARTTENAEKFFGLPRAG